jgi:hypothetical protein
VVGRRYRLGPKTIGNDSRIYSELVAQFYKLDNLIEIQKRFTSGKTYSANICPGHLDNDLFGPIMIHFSTGRKIFPGHAMLTPDIAPG